MAGLFLGSACVRVKPPLSARESSGAGRPRMLFAPGRATPLVTEIRQLVTPAKVPATSRPPPLSVFAETSELTISRAGSVDGARKIALAASIALAADIHVDSAAAALDADPGVARLADLKPLALQAHGLRRAGATSPTTVQVVIGASMTGAAGKAEAYRIIGEGDPAYAYRDFVRPVKVNQVGYVPDGLKLARVGRWLGSFPDPAAKPAAGAAGAAADDGAAGMSAAALFAKGPVIDATSPVDGHTAFHRSLAPWALRFDAPPAFEIRRADTHEAVLSGTATLKSNGGEVDGRVNHSAENVFEIDFTSFETPGRYYIAIAGVGRSFAFGVGEDVYQTAFETQAYGVFAQRCGQELAPPYSDWERIACHVAGVVPTTEKRHLTHEFGKFVENRIPVVLPASGGHHDAGDYNPRSHIDVAQTLLTAYELFPKKFFDGQLNIPEKANGIPDIVDEALWALRLWDGLYDPETGAVYNGTESQGDPNFIQTVELDDKGDYAWAPDAQGALNYAGTLAQTARILAASGKTEQAAASLARAEKAYAWGKANKPGVTDVRAFGRFYVAPLAFAAAQLFHATGKPGYHEDFLANTPWRANPQAEMIAGDGAYDLSLAACAYALMPDAQADAAVKRAALASIRREADMYIDGSSKMAYAFIRHPYAPITWGTGAYHNFCMPALHLAALAESPEDRARYREWLIRSADNTLGGNPMNLSWVVGLGSQTIRAPLHNSRYSKFGMPVRGMQSEGPNQRGEGYNYGETVYPKHSDSFAVMHAFIDSSFAIAMDEGVVPLQAKSMALFGALLPDHP